MTRTRNLIVATVVALALPLSGALGQTPPFAEVAPADADMNPARTLPASPDDVRSPMQEQAMVPNVAPVTETCSNRPPVTIKDEAGREYNCRGDRVR